METALDHPGCPLPGAAPLIGDRPSRPDLLIVGGTGRSSGKTELACRLIRRHADSTPVVGLKVTAVERAGGDCPHGGTGCGVCSSLDRPWIVSRDEDPGTPKDTGRMLASGARRVYWLRALRPELADGAADLLRRVPPGWVGVCESTSFREVVEPGLFLLVRAAGHTPVKPSARAVAHLAERVVVSDGRSFDLDLDRISVVDGQWALRRETLAVVVGGVGDRRDGGRAAALRRTWASLGPQFDRIVAGAGAAAAGPFPAPPTGPPESPGEWCLVTLPLAGGVPPGLVNAMFRRRAGVDVVVALTGADDVHGCLALCRRGLLPEAISAIRLGSRAEAALRAHHTVRTLRWAAAGPATGPGSPQPAVVRAAPPVPACRSEAEAG